MKIDQIAQRSTDRVDVTFTDDRGKRRNATIFHGDKCAVMEIAARGTLSFVPQAMIPAALAPAVDALAA